MALLVDDQVEFGARLRLGSGSAAASPVILVPHAHNFAVLVWHRTELRVKASSRS
jgi:hypothetical protein